MALTGGELALIAILATVLASILCYAIYSRYSVTIEVEIDPVTKKAVARMKLKPR